MKMWMKTRNNLDEQIWYRYLFFAVLRVVLIFIPQLGIVHPDEFFQSVEVMTGDHFRVEHTRTWEFNNSFPLRSITLPFFIFRVPWSFLEFFALYIREYLGLEILIGYTYLVFPRFILCCLSFIIDWCMFRVCRFYSMRYEIRLLTLASSWVMLVFGTRTFSNTLEMIFCALLLSLVAECMIKTNTIVYKKELLEERYEKAESIGERVKIWKLKLALPAHNFTHMIVLASVCVAGVFNRPTFLLFGAPMVFYWMLRGMGTKTVTFTDFNLRMLLFCLSTLPAIVIFIFCDSLYYKHLTVGELQMLDLSIENFVFTPWNFIKYNIDSNKTAHHGLHPKYVHLLVNVPLLYNILGIIAMVSFAQLMVRFFRAEYQGLPRAQSMVGLMSGAIFVPLFFLSLINHQEARFLIPLTFPIVLLHGPKLLTGFCAAYPFREEHRLLRKLYESILCTKASEKFILKTWYTCNIALTIFFGFIHQAGIFPLTQHLEYEMQIAPKTMQTHLITSHIYMLPVSFLNIPSAEQLHFDRQTRQYFKRQRSFYLYEYGGLNLTQLHGKLKLIISHCELKRTTKSQDYRLLLAIPTSLSADFTQMLDYSNATYLHWELKRIFYPHLSTEAFPHMYGRHPCDVHPPDPPKTMDDDLKGTCSAELSPTLSVEYVLNQVSSFLHQFGLALYEIKMKYSGGDNIGKTGTIYKLPSKSVKLSQFEIESD